MLLLLLSLACSQPDPIEGSWVGASLGHTPLQVHFGPGQALEVTINSAPRSGRWAIDRSTTPIALDLTLDGQATLHTIVDFPDHHSLRYVDLSASDPRPTRFGVGTLTLIRQP